MKPFTRKASVLWLGTCERGKGAISTPSAILKKASYASGSDARRHGTSPPELIAAAHAGSFSMTLAHELGAAGYRPRQIDTTGTLTMEDIAAGGASRPLILDVGNLGAADIALREIIEDKIGFVMPDIIELTRPTGKGRKRPQQWGRHKTTATADENGSQDSPARKRALTHG